MYLNEINKSIHQTDDAITLREYLTIYGKYYAQTLHELKTIIDSAETKEFKMTSYGILVNYAGCENREYYRIVFGIYDFHILDENIKEEGLVGVAYDPEKKEYFSYLTEAKYLGKNYKYKIDKESCKKLYEHVVDNFDYYNTNSPIKFEMSGTIETLNNSFCQYKFSNKVHLVYQSFIHYPEGISLEVSIYNENTKDHNLTITKFEIDEYEQDLKISSEIISKYLDGIMIDIDKLPTYIQRYIKEKNKEKSLGHN